MSALAAGQILSDRDWTWIFILFWIVSGAFTAWLNAKYGNKDK